VSLNLAHPVHVSTFDQMNLFVTKLFAVRSSLWSRIKCYTTSVRLSVRPTRASDLLGQQLRVPPDELRFNTSRPFDLPPVLARIHETKRLTST